MKKIFAVLMMLAMLAAMPFAAMAEEPETDTQLEGIVLSIVEDGFVLQDTDTGRVMVNTSEATVWDGILLEGELMEGQYVFVDYDGRTTFSLPPQAHADRVLCAMLTGTVTEVLEDNDILMNDDTFGEVIVHLGEGNHHVYADMPITVYYNGMMALSLPGQVTASHIVLPQLDGVVSNLTEEGFTLTDEYGMEYLVLFSEETFVSEEILPVAIEEAEEAAETEEETAETEAVEEAADIVAESAESMCESTVEWGEGDTVTVYYNGMMSRSIPAQVTAMEIVVIR